MIALLHPAFWKKSSDKKIDGSREEAADVLQRTIGIEYPWNELHDILILLRIEKIFKRFECSRIEIHIAVDDQMEILISFAQGDVMSGSIPDIGVYQILYSCFMQLLTVLAKSVFLASIVNDKHPLDTR